MECIQEEVEDRHSMGKQICWNQMMHLVGQSSLCLSSTPVLQQFKSTCETVQIRHRCNMVILTRTEDAHDGFSHSGLRSLMRGTDDASA